MPLPWNRTFERADVHTDTRRELELDGPALDGVLKEHPEPEVLTVPGTTGDASTLDIRPPDHTVGLAIFGWVMLLVFLYVAWAVWHGAAGEELGFRVFMTAFVFVFTVGICVVFIASAWAWRLDAQGFHSRNGYGKRSTAWDAVRRVRVVSLLHSGRRAYMAGHRNRLYLLDEEGKVLNWMPYVTPGRFGDSGVEHQVTDIRRLVAFAAECRRRGWLSRLA